MSLNSESRSPECRTFTRVHSPEYILQSGRLKSSNIVRMVGEFYCHTANRLCGTVLSLSLSFSECSLWIERHRSNCITANRIFGILRTTSLVIKSLKMAYCERHRWKPLYWEPHRYEWYRPNGIVRTASFVQHRPNHIARIAAKCSPEVQLGSTRGMDFPMRLFNESAANSEETLNFFRSKMIELIPASSMNQLQMNRCYELLPWIVAMNRCHQSLAILKSLWFTTYESQLAKVTSCESSQNEW